MMNSIESKEKMNIVIVGHVDHGKSTIIGRLLADTNSLPEGKLAQVKDLCEKNSKPFEYAFLLDALKDEQAQGITIDTARIFFHTKKRNYIILDAPGHIEFLKNMITGASRAEAALLVIDAKEGVRENSRRHGYMLAMLGIKQVVILVNKMDLVQYDNEVFNKIKDEYILFLNDITIKPLAFIPVSGFSGDNIASKSTQMTWFKGKTVLETLDYFKKDISTENKPFRLFVQDVYKFTKFGDDRRIIAGLVDSGKASIGDEIVFSPSGKKSTIKTIEVFNDKPKKTITQKEAVGFTLEEQIYITRGELASLNTEIAPKVSSRFKVNLFWLSKSNLVKNKEYLFKIGSIKIQMKVEQIESVLNASNLKSLDKPDYVGRHDVATCILKTKKAIAFDLNELIPATSRFVLVDNYEICGGGLITKSLEDNQKWIREKVFLRNYKWEQSLISIDERNERYNQKSALILITGDKDSGKKTLARKLEAKLFVDGKFVYFLGIGNILYGVDADIKDRESKLKHRDEHLRRLAEVSHLMIDAGMILIVTAIGLTLKDLEIIKSTISSDLIETIWLGDNATTDINYDMIIPNHENFDESIDKIKIRLQEKGIIFQPW